MNLDIEKMNNKLLKEWLNKYTTLENEKKEMLQKMVNGLNRNLSFLYDINRILLTGEGIILEENIGYTFACGNGVGKLYNEENSLELNNEMFRDIIAVMIDIYEDIYPLGTVVDLKKKYYKDILPIDKIEHIRVVITYRFIPCSDKMFMPYMGLVYPIGNDGIKTNGIHFTTKTIEKVVYMGYIDEEEIKFIYKAKYDILVNKNMHSTGFIKKGEFDAINNN